MRLLFNWLQLPHRNLSIKAVLQKWLQDLRSCATSHASSGKRCSIGKRRERVLQRSTISKFTIWRLPLSKSNQAHKAAWRVYGYSWERKNSQMPSVVLLRILEHSITLTIKTIMLQGMLQYCRYMPCLYLETIFEYCKVIFIRWKYYLY